VQLSILDQSPVIGALGARRAIEETIALARRADELGYHRYWLAEHHNMPGIASAATAVVIAHVAAGTSTIRVGAGGIMLPNHAPLMVAEAFGTLASLHPGRIDLGLGRAPGTDQITAHALRRSMNAANVDSFPNDVVELMSYFRAEEPGQRVRAVPGAGLGVPVWMLRGWIVEMGPVEQVLGDPLHPYTQSLKEAIPQADPDKVWDKRANLAELDTVGYTRVGCRFAGRCPAVMDICRQKVPPDFKPQGRTVKCFLYDESESTRVEPANRTHRASRGEAHLR
jgi:oligopeptide/dipeptide ABC transporter ATP-binding protein